MKLKNWKVLAAALGAAVIVGGFNAASIAGLAVHTKNAAVLYKRFVLCFVIRHIFVKMRVGKLFRKPLCIGNHLRNIRP